MRPLIWLQLALATGLLACESKAPRAEGSAVTSGDCPMLTAADIKSVTGAQVHPIARLSATGAGGTCGNYATASGENYLGVNQLSSPAEYQASVAAVPADVYPEKETLSRVGDEAVVFKAPGHIRYLVARSGNRGVVLFYAGETPTDEQLKQLAIRALGAR
jgi:hypothetical protein